MSTVTDLKKRIYALRDLPTLPVVARRILEAVEAPDSSHRALAEIVSKDQSLAAKVLGLSNSAYYGHRARIRTLNHAITIIGTSMLRQLSLCAFVMRGWGSGGDDRARFWKHSLAVAYGASFVAEEVKHPNPAEAFCAGLLHDIGILVMDMAFPRQYEHVREQLADSDRLRHEVEQSVMGVDHGQAGAWLAERWQLPEALIESIRTHHDDGSEAPVTELSGIVRISDAAAARTEMGIDGEGTLDCKDDAGGLELARVVVHLESRAPHIEQFFSVL